MVTRRYSSDSDQEREGAELSEKVVDISRVAKVVKGGRHLSFDAAVVVGDGRGRVGFGLGKADAVPDAVRKGTAIAKKNLTTVILKGSTIPHTVLSKFEASQVLMKPASPGKGIIAGGAVRALSMESRMTVCNMSIEAGARAGLIAPDDVTFDYMRGRPQVPTGDQFEDAVEEWRSLATDRDACFDNSLYRVANFRAAPN